MDNSIRKHTRRGFLAGTLGCGAVSALGVFLATPRPGPLVVTTGTATVRLLRKLVGEWNENNPGTPAVVEDVGESTGDQYAAMKVRAKQGWGDILHLDSIYVSEFATAGWLSELPGDLVKDDLLPSPVKTCRRGPGGKELFALPFNTDVGVVFSESDWPSGVVNQDVLNLKDLLDHLRDHGQQFVGQFGQPNEAFFVNVLEHALAVKDHLLSVDGTLDLDLDDWREALAPLIGAFTSKKIYSAEDEVSAVTTFWTDDPIPGHPRYMRNWPFRGFAGAFDRGKPTPRVAALDHGVLGGQNLAVVAASSRQEPAIKLLGHLTTQQSQRDLVAHGLVPVDRRVYDDATVLASRPELKIVLKGIEAARPRPIVPNYLELSQAFRTSLKADNFRLNNDSMDKLRGILQSGAQQ